MQGGGDILTENKNATKQMQTLSILCDDGECIFYVKRSLMGQTAIRKFKFRHILS